MASRDIDVNRGVTIWKHPKGGMDVFMYKDTPGIYLDAHGREIPEKMAQQSGAPVEKYRKRRMIQEEQAKVAEALREKYDVDAPEVVTEVNGLQLMELPGGMMRVAREGEYLSDPIPPGFARELFEDMSGVKLEEEDASPKAEEEKGEMNDGEKSEA